MISAAGPGDAATVAALEAVSLGADAWSASLIEQGITGSLPTVYYLVSRDGDGVVGYAVASVAGDVVELQRIAVDPSRRRDGRASSLLAEVIRLGHVDGAERVVLEVREDNGGARGFYVARGFTEIARRARYYRDGTTAVVMELPLTGPDVKVWTTS